VVSFSAILTSFYVTYSFNEFVLSYCYFICFSNSFIFCSIVASFYNKTFNCFSFSEFWLFASFIAFFCFARSDLSDSISLDVDGLVVY
jgi:hypothetical protein